MRELLARGNEAAFHELVRMLEALPQRDDRVPVGHQGPPSREGVRFRPALDLSFGVSEVDACELDADTGVYSLTTRFFGLYGTPSPLPAQYTEQLLYDDADGRLRAFLDVFNHRLLSFFYRGWQKYRHAATYDGRGTDVTSQRLRIFSHLDRLGEPLPLLGFAGLLHQRPLSEESLERILQAMLQVPLEVHSCHLRRVAIPDHQTTRLGLRNCELGGQVPLGDSMLSATCTFRVELGPLDREVYLAFLPGGARRRELEALIDRLNGDFLDCQIEVRIAPAAITAYRLGAARGGLGCTTWLGDDAATFAPLRGSAGSAALHRPDSSLSNSDPLSNTDPMVA